MKKIIILTGLTMIVWTVVLTVGAPCFAETESTYKQVDMNIDVNKEDKEIGLKRMELLDKALSRDLIERKRQLIKNVETDYNQKISALINDIIPEVFGNKVMTHIDINFFTPEFETQVKASQRVAVSIILKRDGFDTWVQQNASEEMALSMLKQLIEGTFNIPNKNINILIVN